MGHPCGAVCSLHLLLVLSSSSVLPANFQVEEYEPPCAAQCILGELCKRHSGVWVGGEGEGAQWTSTETTTLYTFSTLTQLIHNHPYCPSCRPLPLP